jgi:hypothetical protein
MCLTCTVDTDCGAGGYCVNYDVFGLSGTCTIACGTGEACPVDAECFQITGGADGGVIGTGCYPSTQDCSTTGSTGTTATTGTTTGSTGTSAGTTTGGACGTVTGTGDCTGNVLEYCDSSSGLVSEDCTVFGQQQNGHPWSCGYDSAHSWYDCLDTVDAGPPRGFCADCTTNTQCASGQCSDPLGLGGYCDDASLCASAADCGNVAQCDTDSTSTTYGYCLCPQLQ